MSLPMNLISLNGDTDCYKDSSSETNMTNTVCYFEKYLRMNVFLFCLLIISILLEYIASSPLMQAVVMILEPGTH